MLKTFFLLLATILASAACTPIYWGGEPSPRNVRILKELRVSSECSPVAVEQISAARDAWAASGYPLELRVVQKSSANVLCAEGVLLSRQGETKWVGDSEPVLTLSPVTLDLYTVALHEIGHGLAGDSRHHSSGNLGVMSRRGNISSITGDDLQLIAEARHANW